MTNTQSPTNVRWYQRASIWMGLGINPATISLGGGLAERLSLRDLLWIIPVGSLALTLVCIAQGIIGRRHRFQFAQVAAGTFGHGYGFTALNLLVVVGMIGWGGFQGGISGASAAQLLNWPDWAGAILIISSLLILTQFGINRWSALIWITTIAALALAIFALTTIDLSPVRENLTTPSSPINWLWAIGTTVASAILFSLRCADFSHDMRADADVINANLCLFFTLIFAMFVGALLYGATGIWNIADILTASQSAALGHIFLILAVISPLLSGYYSGALALANISPLTQRQSLLAIGICGMILAASRFDQQLIPFLGVLGASIGPAVAVILASQIFPAKPAKTATNGAWLLGAAIAIIFQLQGSSTHIFAGAVAAIAALLMLYPLTSLPNSVRQ